MGLKKKKGLGDTNVNIFHEDFVWGCMGFLWSAWIVLRLGIVTWI
jgi:hypothetical protein